LDALRNILATIQEQLTKLTALHKLLIAAVVVIMVMAFALSYAWSSKQDYVEFLPNAADAEQTKAATYLKDRNIPFTMSGTRVLVPAARRIDALAAYTQSGNMPDDASMLFRNMLEKQTWYSTRQQNDQVYNIALQNELAAIISRFSGIAKASVIIDAPDRAGLGAGSRRPTAMATVFAAGGLSLDQSTVDAVAGLIASSRVGLTIEAVRVIDGNMRRQRRATANEDMAASTYLEDVTRWENSTREKLVGFLSYIPEVMVAVTAQIDNKRENSVKEEYLPKDAGTVQLLKREKTNSQTETGGTGGGAESGIRSNVGMDVATSPSPAQSGSNKKDEETEFTTFPGRVQSTTADPKGRPTMVAVSVNVPEAFVAAKLSPAGENKDAAAAAAPTPEQLKDKFEKDVKPQIIDSILPHVKAMVAAANPGVTAEDLNRMLLTQVSVSMIPVDLALASTGGGGMLSGGGGGGGSASGGSLPLGLSVGLLENVLLGGMALLAMGMMVVMVNKTARKAELPTAEEIVGLPPALQTKSDLIGEADESDAPMMGIEVDDAEVRTGKMLEQVNEFVKGSPDSAAKLLNRWITTEN
jgi:flagellar biosynthesis/type III secretory pathway M-ring protein FliF/YscJ